MTPESFRRAFRDRATAPLWLAIGLVLFASAVSYLNLRGNRRAGDAARHGREVRLAIAQLHSALDDAETGQRGYLLTGEPSYLQPYRLSVLTIPQRLSALQSLLHADRERQRLASVESLVAAKQTELEKTIRQRHDQGIAAALRTVKEGKGKRLMDAIRAELATMADYEDAAVTELEDREAVYSQETAFVVMGGDLILLAMLATATARVQNELARRRRVESALRASEQSYATTLRGIGDAVIATDAEGRITFMNTVAETLTGWKTSEAAQCPAEHVFRIVNETTGEPVESPIRRVIREGKIIGLANHTILVAKDGSERPIDDSGAPIRDDDGNLVGTVLVFHDITDRRRAEAERDAHLEEVTQLNARLRRGMAESHHRIKNHLQMLGSLVDVQLGDAGTVPRSALERLTQHIGSLAALHDLLTTEAKFGSEMDVVSMREALQKLVPMLQTASEPRQVRLEVDDVSMPQKQAGCVMLILNELVSNAIKHGGGEVEVTLRAIQAGLLLEVCDDGPGFPQGFDPAEASNTGLDLIDTLTRWDLKGTVRYDNRPAGGARVSITIPI